METRVGKEGEGKGDRERGRVTGWFTLFIPSFCHFILFACSSFRSFIHLCRSLFGRCHDLGRPRKDGGRAKRKGKVILMRIQPVCGAISCPLPRLMNARANIISAYVLANLE